MTYNIVDYHMNNNFHDSLYYLKRAAIHAKRGLKETADPAVRRVNARLGRAPSEPEPTRLRRVLHRVSSLPSRVR